MGNPRSPASREEQQQATRRALVSAAQQVFAREGFHGASLEGIAAEAGYSKGAVYSNFASKTDLFSAVLDQRLDDAQQQGVFNPFTADPATLQGRVDEATDLAGLQLACLEFLATVGRDKQLVERVADRRDQVLTLYEQLAATEGQEDDDLDVEDVALLIFALDQGLGMLLAYGLQDRLDVRLAVAGFQRLINPSRAALGDEEPGEPADGTG